jgi:hypothetical protein
MGDESYFSAKYPKGVYRKLLFKIDSGVTTGLEEVESMLVGQFKTQSELTRVYSQKNYHRRFEKDFGTDNLLSYLDIWGTMKSLWTLPKELWLETAMNLRS